MARSGKWLTVRGAADILSLNPDALRRRLERSAVRGPDGATQSNIDGIRARKLGRLWRVQLGPAWSD